MHVLDHGFALFHSVLVGFCLLGWLSRRTRRAHLVTMCLVMLSWFGLGPVYGFGYCPLTDWHWQVKRRLGETGLPASYVKYFVDAATGHDSDRLLVDVSVAVLGIGAFGVSLALNWRDRRRSGAGASRHRADP